MNEIVGTCEECGTGYDSGLVYPMAGDGGIMWYICANENCGVSLPCN